MKRTKEESAKTRRDLIDAARRVFHRRGVVHSSLESIAREAGVTRGALYWHFKGKAELFFVLHQDVFEPLTAQIEEILLSAQSENPLDGIENALNRFFQTLRESPEAGEFFEIMLFQYEYADGLASTHKLLSRQAHEFLKMLEHSYEKAATAGTLRPELDPLATARDTWIFAGGLLQMFFHYRGCRDLCDQISAMIGTHMALRRA